MQAGLIWLRMGTSGGFLQTRWWVFSFHEILVNSWVAERLADYQNVSVPSSFSVTAHDSIKRVPLQARFNECSTPRELINIYNILSEISNVAFDCLAYLPCIGQVLRSNLGPEVATPVKYWNVSSAFPDKWRDCTSNFAMTTSFLVIFNLLFNNYHVLSWIFKEPASTEIVHRQMTGWLLNTVQLVEWQPISVAAPSKAWNVFTLSNTGTVGSNSTQGMGVCLPLFCVCV
jgi:hypothetical protein